MTRRFRRSASFCEPLEPRRMFASGVLADVNTADPSAGLRPFATIGDRLICTAYGSYATVDGLWSTQVTEDAVAVQLTAAKVRSPVLSNRRVFYATDDGTLWSTDGTPGNTRAITHLPGATEDGVGGSSADVPYTLIDVNGIVYVGGKDGLWRSDGTPEGTTRLIGAEGLPFAGVAQLFQRNSDVFFTLTTTDHVTNVMRTDGTVAGTVAVARGIKPDSAFVRYGRNVYFLADDALWRTGGTRATTTRPLVFSPGEMNSYSSNGIAVGGGRIFFATSRVTGLAGRNLWSSDGTKAGTIAIDLGYNSGAVMGTTQFVPYAGGVIFTVSQPAYDPDYGASVGVPELWRSDGTAAGTARVKSFDDGSFIGGAISAGKSVYFVSNYPATNGALWRSDGTSAGTQRIVSMPDYVTTPVVMGDAFYFGGGEGYKIYRSDGTRAGTVAVTGAAAQFASSNAGAVEGSGTTRFFTADDGVHGYALWKTDGTTAGTQYLAPSIGNARLRTVSLNGGTYTIGTVGTGAAARTGLLKLTSSGVTLVKEAPLSADYTQLVVAGGRMYFHVPGVPNRGPQYGAQQLWTSDGTAAGTRAVEGIDFVNRDLYGLFTLGGHAYFTAAHKGNLALWTTDGTTAGTRRLADVGTNQLLSPVASVGATGYFNVFYGAERAIWRTDGTTAGTAKVRDDSSMGSAARLGSTGNTLVFTRGDELWRTDGTDAGTTLVLDFGAGGVPSQLTAMNGRVYFSVAARRRGDELWVTDGTAAGTHLVKDVRPGPSGSSIQEMTLFKGRLYFTADDGVSGRELWESDGTEMGTKLAAEGLIGAGDGRVENLRVFGERLTFTATSPTAGRELHYFTRA